MSKDYKERQNKPPHLSGVHYDRIPDHCISDAKTIIDIGCMSGLNALLSRHRDYFLEAEQRGDFLGVDLFKYPKQYLGPIEISDIMDFETNKRFDLVLALHIIEHIPKQLWPKLFLKLKGLVASGGYLVIDAPYNEAEGFRSEHVVHLIDEDMLRGVMGDSAIIEVRKERYRHFRDFGESLLRALVRFVWRILTRHRYNYFSANKHIMAIWQKVGK